MNYNDSIIERAESCYNDEFERRVMNQASTLALSYITKFQLVLAAVLAWLLPGNLSMLSFLAILPTVASSFIASRWMTKRIPRPVAKFNNTTVAEWLIVLILVVLWLAGLWVNYSSQDSATGLGQIVGAITGAASVLILLPIITKWQRRRDEKRIDAELGDD